MQKQLDRIEIEQMQMEQGKVHPTVVKTKPVGTGKEEKHCSRPSYEADLTHLTSNEENKTSTTNTHQTNDNQDQFDIKILVY